MDEQQFDSLARSFANQAPRRAAMQRLGGTAALQNQFWVTTVVGVSQSLASGETRFATANCSVDSGVQTIAVGDSMEASPASVSVRALTVDLDAQSRPTIARVAAKATNGATNITGVAMCLRLP